MFPNFFSYFDNSKSHSFLLSEEFCSIGLEPQFPTFYLYSIESLSVPSQSLPIDGRGITIGVSSYYIVLKLLIKYVGELTK